MIVRAGRAPSRRIGAELAPFLRDARERIREPPRRVTDTGSVFVADRVVATVSVAGIESEVVG